MKKLWVKLQKIRKLTEIHDENEIEACSTPHGCSPRREGMQSSADKPTPNLEGEEEEEDAAVAARGFAAPPLTEEDEVAFQQLWDMWAARERFYPRGDLAKSRAAFASDLQRA